MHLPIRSLSVSLISVVIISLFLGVTGVWAFPSIGDIIGSITGVKESTLKEIVDPVTKKIPLILLPQGVGSGLDSDKLDGEHGSFYAKEADLTSLSTRLTDLETQLNSVQTSGTPTTTGVTKLNSLTGDLVIIGGTGIFVLTDSSNLTISVANAPYSALNLAASIKNADISNSAAISYAKLNLSNTILSSDVFDGTIANADISSTAGVAYPKLNLTGQISGTDLSSSIAISTTGNLTTTGSGTITSAGILTASSGFTLASGALTLPSGSISDSSLSTNAALLSGVQTFSGAKTFSSLLTASSGFSLSAGTLTLPSTSVSDTALSSNVALLTGSQTFTGSKTFSAALTLPTTVNSVNGLIISSGAVSGITTLGLSGAITGATATNTINGLIINSGALSGITTLIGSGNINTTGGVLQTNSVTRIDNSGAGTLASLSLTTPLTVANGGTGLATITANGILYGNGTSAVGVTSSGTAGQVLTSNGTGVAPTFQAAPGGWTTGETVDTTTAIAQLGSVTLNIPIGSGKTLVMIHMRKTSSFSAWVQATCDTTATNATAIAASSSIPYVRMAHRTDDTSLSSAAPSETFGAGTSAVYLRNCYISGSNLVLEFLENNSGATTLSIRVRWRAT